jgi:hypothetical protein
VPAVRSSTFPVEVRSAQIRPTPCDLRMTAAEKKTSPSRTIFAQDQWATRGVQRHF